MTFVKKHLPWFLWSISFFLITISVYWGLVVTGGPVGQENLRLDQKRSQDLSSIRQKIYNYYRREEHLPDSLLSLYPREGLDSAMPVDPKTKQSYRYHKLDDGQFKLCANYSLERLSSSDRSYEMYYADNSIQYHRKGLNCFSFQKRKSISGKSSYDTFEKL